MNRYLIALTAVARRQIPPIDLAREIPAKFNIIIIERGYRGRSLTVEMDDSLVESILASFPVTIERPQEMGIYR